MKHCEFVEIATNVFLEAGHSKRYALLKAWRIWRAVLERCEPQTGALASAGICEECLQAGWLIELENGNRTCLNCGAEYLVLED